MRKVLKDSRRLAQKISGEKRVFRRKQQHVQRSCGRECARPVPGTPRVPAWLEKIRRQEYRVGAEQG